MADSDPSNILPGSETFRPLARKYSIKVLTERIKLLVIYSPPFGEDPAKVIHEPAKTAEAVDVH